MVFYNSNYNCNNSIEDMTVSMSLTSDSYKKINKRVSNSSLNNSNNSNSSNINGNNNHMYANCCESKLAVVDLVILIAVIGAFGFLLFPYVKFTYVKGFEIGSLVYYVLEDEICENPVIYASLGVSIVCVAMAAWAIVMCTTRKCRNPTCRGLWKAAEFDIQLETEECVKSLNSVVGAKDGVKKGLFELPRDHHRELEAELKKIAPPNGRAVLVFRARCGCSVGRMEVPGPKRVARKIKK